MFLKQICAYLFTAGHNAFKWEAPIQCTHVEGCQGFIFNHSILLVLSCNRWLLGIWSLGKFPSTFIIIIFNLINTSKIVHLLTENFSLIWTDPERRRHANRPLRVPLSDRFALHPWTNKLVCHNQRGGRLPNIWYADVRRYGIQGHQEAEETVPVVVPCHPTGHVWLRVLLCCRGNPLLGKLCGSDWRDRIARDFGLSVFYVSEDQEASDIRPDVVAELGIGGSWNEPEWGVDCSWIVCGDWHWHWSQLL